MKRGSIIFLVLAAALLGAIIYCPANLLRGVINENLQGVARLENMNGTIWNGNALLVFNQKQLPQTPVNWGFAPSLLLSAQLGYTIEINKNNTRPSEIFGEFKVGQGFSGLQIRNAQLNAPASAILPLLNPALSFGGFVGQLNLNTENLEITPSPNFVAAKVAGRATLNWHNANSLFLLGNAANHYTLEFDGKGAESAFVLKTKSGPVAVNGQGTRVLEKTAPYNTVLFSGRAAMPPALLARMGNAQAWLSQLGRMEGDALVMNWTGRF